MFLLERYTVKISKQMTKMIPKGKKKVTMKINFQMIQNLQNIPKKEFMTKKRVRPAFDKKGKRKYNFEEEEETTKTRKKETVEDYNNW